MINSKKACLLATIGMLMVPAALMASTHVHQEVVEDSNGQLVTSTNGNCVVTKWVSNVDECGDFNVRRLSKAQRTVYFDFNKSTLNASERAKLDGLAKVIAASKEVENVDIVGYADRIGNPSYNRSLSKRRADTVKAFLASKGLKTRNVRVEAMGENQSVTNCDNDMPRDALIACLAADRRVEIELNFVK